MKSVNEIENKFISAYLINGNCTEAYLSIRPHVKRETARIEGSRMKRRPHVTAALQEHNSAITTQSQDQASLTKTKLISATQWGIDKAKEKEELAALFKGIDVGSKLIGAYSQDEDDESKYAKFINKISVKQLNINVGQNTPVIKPCDDTIESTCQEVPESAQDSITDHYSSNT